ncbi:hypothetical protein BDP27DRAFT_1408009 [Rhodocollybia butyracea]|uniref:Uncharacterized protein n=1 Tax=Rhodocollybia butyracea TaxID=206335 RepID=A0A9P5TYX0_9AGAR|nr:hypothetical protein BDP27DRAFT_1408009 [Rhodocollybia butyracea]
MGKAEARATDEVVKKAVISVSQSRQRRWQQKSALWFLSQDGYLTHASFGGAISRCLGTGIIYIWLFPLQQLQHLNMKCAIRTFRILRSYLRYESNRDAFNEALKGYRLSVGYLLISIRLGLAIIVKGKEYDVGPRNLFGMARVELVPMLSQGGNAPGTCFENTHSKNFPQEHYPSYSNPPLTPSYPSTASTRSYETDLALAQLAMGNVVELDIYGCGYDIWGEVRATAIFSVLDM